VDKGKVSLEDGGPVSQMQKIALQRVNPDGSRHYLSAAGPLPGTPGVIAPPTPGMSSQAGTHPLLFQSPRVREEVKDGYRVVCDEVDDYLCWTIVGICMLLNSCLVLTRLDVYITAQFQYAFFDALGQNGNIPDLPITPFPTLFTAPIYRPSSNHVELTVSNFFYEHPTTKQQTPLDVYLGNMGPLNLRVYQATPPGPLTNVQPYVTPGGQLITPGSDRFLQTPLHTIVIVDMPPIQDVMKNLEEQLTPPSNPTETKPPSEEGSSSDGTRPHPSMALSGRGLPLLFIRSSDGIGYHSGRTLACENVFHNLGPIAAPNANGETNWLTTAVAEGWTLRVL
jgi:recombining binding protein (suppressor of hairless)